MLSASIDENFLYNQGMLFGLPNLPVPGKSRISKSMVMNSMRVRNILLHKGKLATFGVVKTSKASELRSIRNQMKTGRKSPNFITSQ